jgi:hypothetical protein
VNDCSSKDWSMREERGGEAKAEVEEVEVGRLLKDGEEVYSGTSRCWSCCGS